MPALAYVNGPVARVLMVELGRLAVGVTVVGVAVVTVSALGQPVHSKDDTRKWTSHFSFDMKCLHCYTSQVARLGWPASALHLACIQPIR